MKNFFLLWGLTFGMALSDVISAAEVVGNVRFVSGGLMAQRVDGTAKVMGAKADVQLGDMLVTASDSYAQVVMNDGTKMILRPNSNLKIEGYQFNQQDPKSDSAIFRLLKGGFRTVTGLIGKRGNPDAYKLRSSGATIGIRGTDFTSRLCGATDCLDEALKTPAKKITPAPKAVGRVMQIQGEMSATDVSGKVRKLTLGSPVFEGDTLQAAVQSNGVVMFRDGGRITLQQNSDFVVEAFKYDKNNVGQDNIALRLLKGGVRVVTGLIGHVNHDNYKFRLSGATIGIRGTGFDAWCNGPCADGSANFGATQENPLAGAGVFVWSGEVALMSAKGSVNVSVNQAAIISRETGNAVQVNSLPDSIKNNPVPKPDSVSGDAESTFEEVPRNGEAGVYVSVHEGQVILENGGSRLDLGQNESGFTDGAVTTRLSDTPQFLLRDNKLDQIGKSSMFNSGINSNGCLVAP